MQSAPGVGLGMQWLSGFRFRVCRVWGLGFRGLGFRVYRVFGVATSLREWVFWVRKSWQG